MAKEESKQIYEEKFKASQKLARKIDSENLAEIENKLENSGMGSENESPNRKAMNSQEEKVGCLILFQKKYMITNF